MPSALILIADGTEEIEFVTPYDVLTRAGFNIRSAGVGLTQKHAVCSRYVKITPDHHSIESVLTRAFPIQDILILPGGAAGAKTFCESEKVLEAVQQYRAEGKYIASICAATTALVKAGGDKCKVTSHPSVKDDIVAAGWDYSEERVCVDGKMITSRGPGTALEFSLKIVELMAAAGKEKAEEVAAPMMIN